MYSCTLGFPYWYRSTGNCPHTGILGTMVGSKHGKGQVTGNIRIKECILLEKQSSKAKVATSSHTALNIYKVLKLEVFFHLEDQTQKMNIQSTQLHS